MNTVVERCDHDREVVGGDRLRRRIELRVADRATGAIAVGATRDGDYFAVEWIVLDLEAQVIRRVLELDDAGVVEGDDTPDLCSSRRADAWREHYRIGFASASRGDAKG